MKKGYLLAGGEHEGEDLPIAHMGYAEKFDVITAVAATEMTLKSLGYPVTLGKGVAAAMEILEA